MQNDVRPMLNNNTWRDEDEDEEWFGSDFEEEVRFLRWAGEWVIETFVTLFVMLEIIITVFPALRELLGLTHR
jgi:hypothetical protein